MRGSVISPWLVTDVYLEGDRWKNTYSELYHFGNKPTMLVMVSHPGLISPFWEMANLFTGDDVAMTHEERIRAIHKVVIPQTLSDERFDLAKQFQNLIATELELLGTKAQYPITGNPAAEAIAATVNLTDNRPARNCFNTLSSCGMRTEQAKGSTESEHKKRPILPQYVSFANTALQVIEHHYPKPVTA